MNQLELTNVIKAGLVDSINNIEMSQINLDSHLKNDLGLDSLSSMFFLTYLEENIPNFNVNPDTIEARSFNTVETIYEYIVGEMVGIPV